MIRRALRGETFVAAGDAFEILRSHPHGHVAAVLGTLEKLGLNRMIGVRRGAERDRCVALIASRLLAPGSKLATARGLDGESATSTLGEALGVEGVSADDFYAAMDWPLERQGKIETALAHRHLWDGTRCSTT